MADQSMQTVTRDIEKDLIEVIIQNLEQNKIDTEEAKKVAQEFLSLLPLHDKKDLLEKLNKLGKDHLETQSVFLKYARPYEEKERQRKLELMSQHIKKGQIDHALAVAKE